MPRAKITFDSEKRVRAWVRERTINPLWVEPTRGSTNGAPDVFVRDRGGIWIELKHGECRDRRLLRWKARPGQYFAIRNLRDAGCRVGFLVGFGTKLFVSTDPELFRANWAEIRAEDLPEFRDPEAWKTVLDTIVSGCEETGKAS